LSSAMFDEWDIPTLLNKFEKCGIVVPEHITQDSFETVWDSHTQERKNRKDTVTLRVKQDVEDHYRFTSSPIQVYPLLVVSLDFSKRKNRYWARTLTFNPNRLKRKGITFGG
jgi:hypothetical protein